MALPTIRAQEVLQNVGVIRAGDAGAGLRTLGLGLAAIGQDISREAEKEAVAQAEIEGNNAVTRDEFGNLRMVQVDTSGPAGRARQKAQFQRYLAELEIDVQRHVSEIQVGHKNDPEGFQQALEGYSAGVLQNVPDALRGSAATIVNKYGRQGYTHVLTQRQARDDALAAVAYKSTLEKHMQDADALAAGGHFGSEAYGKAIAEVEVQLRRGMEAGLIDEEIANNYRDRLAETGEGHSVARSAIEAYRKAGGGAAGLQAAEDVLNKFRDDPDLKLDSGRRERLITHARKEVHNLESIRGKELSDIRAEAAEDMIRLSLGRPVDEVKTLALARRARAAGDPELSRRLTDGIQLQRDVSAFSKLPLDIQAAVLADAGKQAADPSSGAMGALRFEALQKAHAAKANAIKNDALGTLASIHNVPLAPIDWTKDPRQALRQRVAAAENLSAVERVPVLPLTKDEIGRLSGAISAMPEKDKAQFAAMLADGMGPEHLSRVSNELIKKDQSARLFAGFAMLALEAPDVARMGFLGEQTMKANPKVIPENDLARRDLVNRKVGDALALMPETRGLVEEMSLALYAADAGLAGDVTGKLDASRLDKAVDMVLGGTVKYRGRKLVPPQRFMKQGEFDSLMSGLTDDDLIASGPGVHGDGKKVTAEDIRRNGTLWSVGQGIYEVRFNGLAARIPETNKPWRLNLRGVVARTVAPVGTPNVVSP